MIPPLLINRNDGSDEEFSTGDSSLGSNSTDFMPVLRSDHDIYIFEESDDDISILGISDYPQYDEIYHDALDPNDDCSFYSCKLDDENKDTMSSSNETSWLGNIFSYLFFNSLACDTDD